MTTTGSSTPRFAISADGLRYGLSVLVALAVATTAGALAVHQGFAASRIVWAAAALFLLMLPYVTLALAPLAATLAWWLRLRPALAFVAPLYFCLVYGVYGGTTGTFRADSLLDLAAFTILPTVLLYASVKSRGPGTVGVPELLGVLAIWIPFDLRILGGIWTWPEGVGYVLNTAVAATLAVVLFVCLKGVSNVKFSLQLTLRDLKEGALLLGGFSLIAIPFGLATGFIEFAPQFEGLVVISSSVAFFFFVALPEELLFRGLIQNFLHRQFASAWLPLGITSIFFGLTHLNNGPAPDWRFAALATVAGVFYGVSYLRSQSLAAPALLHTAVHFITLVFFQGNWP